MKTQKTIIKLSVLIPLLVSVSQVKGAEHLTINGDEVDSINLSVDQSCTIEVVSNGGALPYIEKLDPTNFNLSDLELIEIKPEAGVGASVTPQGDTEYKLIAGTGMVAGVHFVFGYTATATGQKEIELKALLGGVPLDSIVINVTAAPAGTAFTYQGRLWDAGEPADGTYDLQCKLFDSKTDGTQIGQTLVFEDGSATDGYFTIEIDFGVEVFNGDARYLEMTVRQGTQTQPSDFVTLTPRTELTATPYALQTRGIYVDPNMLVGIGTTSPSEKLDVEGNIDVSSNRVKNYRGFPRPDYDSGWVWIGIGQRIELSHQLGGDPDNYFVDLQLRDSDFEYGRHVYHYGGDIRYINDGNVDFSGAFWCLLTNNSIAVERGEDDADAEQVRIRIWVYD